MAESAAPTAGTPKPKKSVALSGVVAGNTALCTVGRTGNDLHYRGYDILDMADVSEFEEIAHLLVHEKLPTVAELAPGLAGGPATDPRDPRTHPCRGASHGRHADRGFGAGHRRAGELGS
jgi:hypothetical protein